MLSIVPSCPFSIMCQLSLGHFPYLRLHHGRNADGNPFLSWAQNASSPIPWPPILKPSCPMRAVRVGFLLPIVPRFSFIKGTPQDIDHRALCPSLSMCLAGRNALFQETPLNGIGTESFLDEPPIQLLHNGGFGFADFQALRSRICLPNIAIPIRWISTPIH